MNILSYVQDEVNYHLDFFAWILHGPDFLAVLVKSSGCGTKFKASEPSLLRKSAI
jgi:hypothetical protein